MVTKAQAKANDARRSALVAILEGKSEASGESLSRSYALPVAEVRRIMKSMEVQDND